MVRYVKTFPNGDRWLMDGKKKVRRCKDIDPTGRRSPLQLGKGKVIVDENFHSGSRKNKNKNKKNTVVVDKKTTGPPSEVEVVEESGNKRRLRKCSSDKEDSAPKRKKTKKCSDSSDEECSFDRHRYYTDTRKQMEAEEEMQKISDSDDDGSVHSDLEQSTVSPTQAAEKEDGESLDEDRSDDSKQTSKASSVMDEEDVGDYIKDSERFKSMVKEHVANLIGDDLSAYMSKVFCKAIRDPINKKVSNTLYNNLDAVHGSVCGIGDEVKELRVAMQKEHSHFNQLLSGIDDDQRNGLRWMSNKLEDVVTKLASVSEAITKMNIKLNALNGKIG